MMIYNIAHQKEQNTKNKAQKKQEKKKGEC